MIKKIFNNRRLKWFLFVLMFGLVSLYIGCNLFQVGAYNLPDYIVTKDSNLIDDLNYLGFDLTNQDVFNSYGKIDSSNDFNYESNQNDSNFAWKLLTMEENYTEKNNQVVQYFYFYNRVSRYLDSTPYYSGDKPSSLSSIKNNLSFAIKLSVNNVDYSTDFSTDLNGSHTFDNVGFMTYCSSFENYHYLENPFNSDGFMAQVENRDKGNIVYDSGYEYYILKLRLNLNYANRDESRTYKISEITGTSSLQESGCDYKSNSVDCFYNPSNCNFTFASVYEKGDTGENTNPDDVVVEAPKLENVKALYEESTNTDCINFQFSNIYANSNLTKVKLNDDIIELSKVSGYEDPNFDNKFIGTYQTINYKVSEKGTCTYYIKGFYFGNKYIDVSEQNVKFRYVSTHTSVCIEAKKELYNGLDIMHGSYTIVRFSLQEKDTGFAIENAVEVTAQYYYVKNKKVVSQKVADASFGSYFNAWTSLNNAGDLFGLGANSWNGYLHKLRPQDDSQNNYYSWSFNFDILPQNFDIIQCRYEVDNQIITGSCYKDGLHIEDGKVYDMDGKLRDDYKVDENGGITDNNGKDPGTQNPPTTPTEPDDPDLSIWQRILKFLKDTFGIDLEKYYKTFKTIIIVLLSIVCMPLIITLVNAIIKCIKAIINLFKKKE